MGVHAYAELFGLSAGRLYALLEFLRFWDVLRQCCGVQMSADARAALFRDAGATPLAALAAPAWRR